MTRFQRIILLALILILVVAAALIMVVVLNSPTPRPATITVSSTPLLPAHELTSNAGTAFWESVTAVFERSGQFLTQYASTPPG